MKKVSYNKNIKELKRSIKSTTKAIAGKKSLIINFKKDQNNKNNIHLPDIDLNSSKNKIAAIRGKADSEALVRKHHNSATIYNRKV